MDYNRFGQILVKYGIEREPAWDDLQVLIAQLPPMKQNPLGLYYPDGDPALDVPPNCLWVPPDSDDDTVLHELGHRFGHYYYDDLTEPFAEKYRYKYKPPVAMYLGHGRYTHRCPCCYTGDQVNNNWLIPVLGVGALAGIGALSWALSRRR